MDVFEQLRQKFDGADLFVSGGHSIGGDAGTLHAQRVANTPEWVYDDAQVRSLLLEVFPKLGTDDGQRKRAARWLLIIHTYFRMGWTSGEIADEIGLEDSHVRSIVTRIRRARDGKSSRIANKTRGKRGRPRKELNSVAIQAPYGNSGEDHISL